MQSYYNKFEIKINTTFNDEFQSRGQYCLICNWNDVSFVSGE